MVLWLSRRYWICVITKCAETGRVPPASGVMVSAAELPAGFRTVKTELAASISTIAISTIWDVPVAQPTTVYSKSSPFKVRINCPASFTLTWNITRYVPISANSKELGPDRTIPEPLLGPSYVFSIKIGTHRANLST